MPNRPVIKLKKKVPQFTRDRLRPIASRRQYRAEWRKARNEHIDKHPFCAICDAIGDLVDHIIPAWVAPERFFDKTNFQTMCNSCHKIKTDKDIEKYGRPVYDNIKLTRL